MDRLRTKIFRHIILFVFLVPAVYSQSYTFHTINNGVEEYIKGVKIVKILDSAVTVKGASDNSFQSEVDIIFKKDLILPLSAIIEIQKTHTNDIREFGIHKRQYSYLQELTCGPIIGGALLLGGGALGHAIWRQFRDGSTDFSGEKDIGIVFVGYPIITVIGAVYGGYKFYMSEIGFRIGFRKEYHDVSEHSNEMKKILLLKLYHDK